ncbi:hypothetical protein [Ottowia sp. VDI28]|uniref:hypothetical protein n=1 Tax=Ottowia sp. VDI28 TaxID=3133968 RepID=UPI003C2AF01D
MENIEKPPAQKGPSEEELIAADIAYPAIREARVRQQYERDLSAQQQYLASTGRLEGWR